MGRQSVFISYRRTDTAETAGRIYDFLCAAIGAENVFKDVDNLPLGEAFGQRIKESIARCSVFVALIGPHWLEAIGEDGFRRIDNPQDWVRTELETALADGQVKVVPVTVGGAKMPNASELPATLSGLPQLNAAIVRNDPDFKRDMERLIAAFGPDLNRKHQETLSRTNSTRALQIALEIARSEIQSLLEANSDWRTLDGRQSIHPIRVALHDAEAALDLLKRSGARLPHGLGSKIRHAQTEAKRAAGAATRSFFQGPDSRRVRTFLRRCDDYVMLAYRRASSVNGP